MTTLTRNADLFRQIADQIENDPESYNDGEYIGLDTFALCRITAGIAGWACLLTGWRPERGWPAYVVKGGESRHIDEVAAEALGITADELSKLGAWWNYHADGSDADALRRIADGAPIGGAR